MIDAKTDTMDTELDTTLRCSLTLGARHSVEGFPRGSAVLRRMDSLILTLRKTSCRPLPLRGYPSFPRCRSGAVLELVRMASWGTKGSRRLVHLGGRGPTRTSSERVLFSDRGTYRWLRLEPLELACRRLRSSLGSFGTRRRVKRDKRAPET